MESYRLKASKASFRIHDNGGNGDTFLDILENVLVTYFDCCCVVVALRCCVVVIVVVNAHVNN